jgi:hypothetical protein
MYWQEAIAGTTGRFLGATLITLFYYCFHAGC